MEEHRIKVKIADRIYPQTVSEDNEAAIRKAARNVDEVIREYTRMYPGVSQIDISTVVALNAAVETEALRDKLARMEEKIGSLSDMLEKYVGSLK